MFFGAEPLLFCFLPLQKKILTADHRSAFPISNTCLHKTKAHEPMPSLNFSEAFTFTSVSTYQPAPSPSHKSFLNLI